MIAQIGLSILLLVVIGYAWTQYSLAPVIGVVSMLAAGAGLYLVWLPEHASLIAELVGIGRGVDVILYLWVIISLIVMLNLHLKLRAQMVLITALAREIAIANARTPAMMR